MLEIRHRARGRKTDCDEPDLFGLGQPSHYPDIPGFRDAQASREAARAITVRAGTLRRLVLSRYRAAYPAGLAADEVAKAMGASVLSIRPRVTELKRAGLLEQTPDRHRNDSGLSAHRLRASRLALTHQD